MTFINTQLLFAGRKLFRKWLGAVALACSFSVHASMYLQRLLTPPKSLFCSRVPAVRAVASLEEVGVTSIWQVGTGVGANKMSLLLLKGSRGRDPRNFLYILIQNPTFWFILWLRKWELPVFLSRPLCILGEMKTVGREPKIEAKGQERGGVLGEGQQGGMWYR